MPDTPAEQEKQMAAWGGWFGSLGEGLIDGGSAFGASKSIAPGGAVTAVAGEGLTGYSVVEAADLDAAAALGQGCPILASGGTVEVYAAIEM